MCSLIRVRDCGEWWLYDGNLHRFWGRAQQNRGSQARIRKTRQCGCSGAYIASYCKQHILIKPCACERETSAVVREDCGARDLQCIIWRIARAPRNISRGANFAFMVSLPRCYYWHNKCLIWLNIKCGEVCGARKRDMSSGCLVYGSMKKVYFDGAHRFMRFINNLMAE